MSVVTNTGGVQSRTSVRVVPPLGSAPQILLTANSYAPITTTRQYPQVTFYSAGNTTTSATVGVTGQSYGNGTYVISASSSYGVLNAGAQNFTGAFAFPYGTQQWTTAIGTDPYSTTTDVGAYFGSTSTTVSGAACTGAWIQIQFPVAMNASVLTLYEIGNQNALSDMLVGSNDGSTWTLILQRQTNTAQASNFTSTINLRGNAGYVYYRYIALRINPAAATGLFSLAGFVLTENVNTISASVGTYPAFTVPNAPAAPTFVPNQYVSFPGLGYTSTSNVTPYVNFGSQTFTVGTTGFSAKCTFMFTASNDTTSNERMFEFTNAPPNLQNSIILYRNSNSTDLGFLYSIGTTTYSVFTSGFRFEQNVLYTVVIVYDPTLSTNGQLKFYVGNGVRVGASPNAVSFPAAKASSSYTFTSTFVGRSSSTVDPAFIGNMYYLAVYNRVLSQQEIIAPGIVFVNAPYFTGSTVPLSVGYTPSSADYTLALWLFYIGGSTVVQTTNFTFGTDGIQFVTSHNSTVFGVGGSVTANTWQHVVLTYTSATSTCVLYTNGSKQTPTTSVPAYNPLGSVQIGGTTWKGYVDDVRMYPYAFTDVSASSLYVAETAVTTDTPPTPNTYVTHDVGVQFGSNTFPTTTSPGNYTIGTYGTIVARSTNRFANNYVTPWFSSGARYFSFPYSVNQDYTIAAWIYYLSGTTLVSTPTLIIGTDGKQFTGSHNGQTFRFGPTVTLPTWSSQNNAQILQSGSNVASGYTVSKNLIQFSGQYPLDLISAGAKSSARGVYSVNRVSSTYTGPIFNINGTDFYADVYGNYNTALNGSGTSLATFLAGATAYVATWYDQSGAGKHATQSTSSLRPILIYTTGSQQVDFTANGGTAYLNLPSGTIPQQTAYTGVSRHNLINNATGPIWSGGNTTTGQSNTLRRNTGTYYNYWYSNDVAAGTYAAGVCITVKFVGPTTSGLTYFYENSITQTPYAGQNRTSWAGAAGNEYLGHSQYGEYLNGQLFYVALFTTALSDADRTIMETFTTASSAVWDSFLYSDVSYISGAYISAIPASTATLGMFGLTSNQKAIAIQLLPYYGLAYYSLQYAWYNNSGTLQIYESGTNIGSYGTCTTSTLLSIVYDGVNVSYLKDNIVQRQVARTPGLPLYGGCAPYSTSNVSLFTNLTFDPGWGIRGTQWQHVAFTYQSDVSTYSIFVNGQKQASGYAPVLNSYSPTVWALNWTGSIDDVRMYTGVVPDVDIAELYLAEAGYPSDTALPIVTTPAWKLDFGGSTMPTVTDTGNYTVTTYGAVTIRSTNRSAKNYNVPYTLSGVKYFSVAYNLPADFTLACWVYGTSGTLFSTNGLTITTDGSTYYMNGTNVGGTFTPSAWQYLTISYLGDFSTANVYIAGAQSSTNIVVNPVYVPDGTTALTVCSAWTGNIDDIWLFPGVISPALIASTYTSENTRAADPALTGAVYTAPDVALNFGYSTISSTSDTYPQDTYVNLTAQETGIYNIAPYQNYPTFYSNLVQFVSSSTQYIDSGTQTWNIATLGMTIVADVTFTGSPTYYEALFGAYTGTITSIDSTNANSIIFGRVGNSLNFMFRLYDSLGNYKQVLTPELAQSRRYTIVATYDPTVSTMTMYLNGTTPVATTSLAVSSNFADRTLTHAVIGGLYYGGYNTVSANVYTFSVYNRVLTTTELSKIFAPTTYAVTNYGLFVVPSNFPYTSGNTYFAFENSFVDLISNLPVTVGGSSVSYVTGKVGYAASFSGNTTGTTPKQWYKIPNPFNGTPFSISFWFYPQATPFYGSILGLHNNAGVSYMNWDYGTSGSVSPIGSVGIFIALPGQWVINNLNSGVLSQNTWAHMCLTVSSSYVATLYVNGVQKAQQTGTNPMSTNASTLTIGGNGDAATPGRGFNGYIDELRTFNRALTSSEIQQQVNQTTNLSTWTRDVPYWSPNIQNQVVTSGPSGQYGQFGYAVALSYDGTTSIISTPRSSTVTVYNVASNSVRNTFTDTGFFGNSVALSSDGTIGVIGNPDQGTTRVVNTLTGATLATLPSAGYSVATSSDGKIVAVGTYGTVVVYSGTNYSTAVTLAYTSSDFGYSVAMNGAGTYVVAGSPNQDYAGVFSASTGALITAFTSTAGSFGYFGYSVAIDLLGNNILVGAPTAANNSGYVGLYTRTSATVVRTITSTAGTFAQFGYSVALSGDGVFALIGAPLSINNPACSGYAGLFTTNNGTLLVDVTQAYPFFGQSVSLTGDGFTVLIGSAGPDVLPFSIDGSTVKFGVPSIGVQYSVQGDYSLAAWINWTSGTSIFYTSNIALLTDGSRYYGVHQGSTFGGVAVPTWNNQVNMVISTNGTTGISTVTTNATGNNSWNGWAYTTQGYVRTAYIFAQANQATSTTQVMFGLSANQTASNPTSTYTSLSYAWFLNTNGTLQIYESGTNIGTFDTYTTSTILKVTYDGFNIVYTKNGQTIRTLARAPGATLYGAVATLNNNNDGATNVDFGANFSRVQPGVWQHVVLTYQGDFNIANLFVNGQQTAYLTNVPANNYLSGPLRIGLGFYGYIDDVRTYPGVLSTSQVSAMYTYESTIPPEPSSVAYNAPTMAINFGTASVPTVSDIGNYALVTTGAVAERSSVRLSRAVVTPFFVPTTKYITVTSQTTAPSLQNPLYVYISTNSAITSVQTFTISQTNTLAIGLQWQYFNVPAGVNIQSQKDTGVTFYVPTGTNLPSITTVTILVINPATSTQASITFTLFATALLGLGGTVTYVNGQAIHTFTTSSSFQMIASGTVQMLLVGGGGGGGCGYEGGGGGGGGYIYQSAYTIPSGTYTVTVGSGGTGGVGAFPPSSGGNTFFSTLLTAYGGGAGGSEQNALGAPYSSYTATGGGSGGGGSWPSLTAGAGVIGQGFSGGTGSGGTQGYIGAGGGGAGGPGSSSTVLIPAVVNPTVGRIYAQFGYSVRISNDASRCIIGAPYQSVSVLSSTTNISYTGTTGTAILTPGLFTFTVNGASGGSSSAGGGQGGVGRQIIATVNIASTITIQYRIGGAGTPGNYGGGGGGATYIYDLTNSRWLFVAGGGNGAGYTIRGGDAGPTSAPGAGGGGAAGSVGGGGGGITGDGGDSAVAGGKSYANGSAGGGFGGYGGGFGGGGGGAAAFTPDGPVREGGGGGGYTGGNAGDNSVGGTSYAIPGSTVTTDTASVSGNGSISYFGTAIYPAAGTAYVYTSSTGALVSTLYNPTLLTNEGFGSAVSLSATGTIAAVGSPVLSNVYVFNAGTGALTTRFSGTVPDQFGFSISQPVVTSISQSVLTTILVGAPSIDGSTGYANVCTANAYTPTGQTYFSNVTLQYTQTSAADYFGYSVAMSGDATKAIVGAPGIETVFIFSATTGIVLGSISSTTTLNAYFGFSVAISYDGTVCIVGAPFANRNAGYAATYSLSAGNALIGSITNTSGESYAQFGYSVAINSNGSIVAVGAPVTASGIGYAALYTQSGALYRSLVTVYPLAGVSVSMSSSSGVVVGAAGPDTLPFQVDGYAVIYL